jgi:hypothetical protein
MFEECFLATANVNEEVEEYIGGLTREEKRKYATASMKLFFGDKSLFYGGSIPEYLLYTDENLNIVMDTKIIEGVKTVFEAMEEESSEARNSIKFNGGILPSTERVISVLEECGRLFIPKPFAAGIMILYFQFCENCYVRG